MASVTLGVKVDKSVRDRLRKAAERVGCTAHALHRKALLAYVEAIEQGRLPDDIEFHAHYAEAGQLVPGHIEWAGRPFFRLAQEVQPQSVLRAAISAAHRRPEPECLPLLCDLASGQADDAPAVQALAHRLAENLRKRGKGGGVESLVHEFSLSSQEGVALMCLAEALLRIPDRATRDALIRDKISKGDWRAHLSESSSLFVNAATWGLMLTGRLVAINSEQSLASALTRMIGKGGEPLVRRGVNTAMRLMGEQFVAGQTISAALANGRRREAQGFRYSFDMLGEAARTAEDAQTYLQAYEQAIHAIGKSAGGRGIYEGPGISIKLSALHPRFERAQRGQVMAQLLPRLIDLIVLAQGYDIGVNIDAEEADRLDLSLDVLEAVCLDSRLAGWHGIGFVVQAYQKRAPYVIDFIVDLAERSARRIMVRLVKGAYWDSEIKHAQVLGLEDFPVFTRKVHTDVSYLACARKLLAAPQAVYPQFATHNAQTLAAVYHMAGRNYYAGQYEFQCLHGMGEALYEMVTQSQAQGGLQRPCRIYAPVGTHETLLAYLVRRLLENGANTSFVNQLGDDGVALEQLLADPLVQARSISPLGAPHPAIVRARDLYLAQEGRLNSAGLDLTNEQRLASLSATLASPAAMSVQAGPMLANRPLTEHRDMPLNWVRNPAAHRDLVGQVAYADSVQLAGAVQSACHAAPVWQATEVTERAQCLRRAARIMEEEMQALMGLIVREAGKSLPNAIAEVREAVDFLRYYAMQIEAGFDNDTHRPLGVVACISPWNFPLAIFTGQISAALAAGNVVLAKPAEQTSLIAAQAVSILHRAGVPDGALQLLPGMGEQIGAELVARPEVQGVLFTGSTAVARFIARVLAQRLDSRGHPVAFIAETGGQNAMVVDSSALNEQVVVDILDSAFDSAGQRCSALRLLCVQDECADSLLRMLTGAMHERVVGNPDRLGVDIGPVIDRSAKATIETHIQAMRDKGHTVIQSPLGEDCEQGTFVPPTIIEIDACTELEQEVFGPVLHVLRYRRRDMDALIDSINGMGYGLTFGIHTRIDETVARLSQRIAAGNIYVNRNMVGAVVGVQPFGGEGLSGTGPKAGGPLYLQRLLATAPSGLPDGCPLGAGSARILPGPTGELNTYYALPRGRVLCVASTPAGVERQLEACRASGNHALFLCEPAAQGELEALAHRISAFYDCVPDAYIDKGDYQAVLFEGDGDRLLMLNRRVAARPGPLVAVQGLGSDEASQNRQYGLSVLLRERSISINTAAAGGNASLMTVG